MGARIGFSGAAAIGLGAEGRLLGGAPVCRTVVVIEADPSTDVSNRDDLGSLRDVQDGAGEGAVGDALVHVLEPTLLDHDDFGACGITSMGRGRRTAGRDHGDMHAEELADADGAAGTGPAAGRRSGRGPSGRRGAAQSRGAEGAWNRAPCSCCRDNGVGAQGSEGGQKIAAVEIAHSHRF